MRPKAISSKNKDPLGNLQRRTVDPGLPARVEQWFRDKFSSLEGISVDVPRTGNGFSSQLYFVEILLDGKALNFVVRQEVSLDATFPLSRFLDEARAMSIAHAAGVLVPKVHWIEEDTSHIGSAFYVMERLLGSIPMDSPHYNASGWLLDGGPQLREKVWYSAIDAMVTLAKAGHEKPELIKTLFNGPAEEAFFSDIDRYITTYEDYTSKRMDSVIYRYRDFIEKKRSADTFYGLSWGDARLPNMVFRNGECLSLIDWEMSSIAPPELDLAYLLLTDTTQQRLGTPTPSGWPTHSETIDYYSRKTDIDFASRLPFLMAVCGLKLGVIHARMKECGHAVPPFDLIEPAISEYLNTR